MKQASAQAPDGENMTWYWVTLTIGIVFFALVAFPFFLLLAAGLAPAITALFVDTEQGKPRVHTLVALNLAGSAPYFGELIAHGGTLAATCAILSNVYAWFAMYGAAAVGFGLLWLGPHVAAVWLDFLSRTEAARLRHRQEALTAEWGRTLARDAAEPPPT